MSRRANLNAPPGVAPSCVEAPGVAPPANGVRAAGRRERGVTPRVVLLALALALLFGYVMPVIDLKLSNTYLGGSHLPPGAVACLLVLVLLINPLLRLLGRWTAFSRNETLTVYISCLFSSLVPGHGAENFFVGNLIAPFYFATPENKWHEFLGSHLKAWFTPALANGSYDRAGHYAVNAWYVKLGPGQSIPWSAWLVPLCAWSAVIMAIYVMLGCLSVLLRAQWSEREALAYPLLRIPLAVTAEGGNPAARGPERVALALAGERSAWLGAGLALGLQALNGLHLYFPDVPAAPLSLAMERYLVSPPWNQLGDISLVVYPVVIGITFLLSSEIALSLWFFYWFIKLQYIAAYYLGYPLGALPRAMGQLIPAFVTYERVGAYLAFAALTLWTGRAAWRHIALRAVGRARAQPEEAAEPLPYPVACWGFVLSLAFVVLWSVAAGMRFSVALYLWGSYLLLAFTLSRVVAEAGLLFVQHGLRPLGVAAQLFGSGGATSWLNAGSIVPGSFVQGALMYDVRGFIMPSFVQSFKLARDRDIPQRPLLALIAAVVVTSYAVSVWMRVRLGYENGGLSLNDWGATAGARLPAKNAALLLAGPTAMSSTNWLWMAVGIATVWAITVARSHWPWFPLHPIGYLTSATYGLDMLWFSILVGWLCKVVMVRYGGIGGYRRATPFFLGLALGDIAAMVLWLAIDGWQGRTGHQLMPG